MKDHVPSFEICQKLKDAGFPQTTQFEFIVENWNSRPKVYFEYLKPAFQRFAAPLLSEILEEIVPATCWNMQIEINGDYFIYTVGEDGMIGISGQNKNPAEAAALLWRELNKKESQDG